MTTEQPTLAVIRDLTDRLDARAARYRLAAESAYRRAGESTSQDPHATTAYIRSEDYGFQARRLAAAARVIREEADR